MDMVADSYGSEMPAGNFYWCLCYCLFPLLIVSRISCAGQLESISITEIQGEYETRIVALVDAPVEYVLDVITDYRHIYRINPSIVESELLQVGDDGVTRVRNRIEHCMYVFCFGIEIVEDVELIGDGNLLATIVPELSSFESGNAMWHLRPFGDQRTRIQYRASFKPDFFIPPVIGSFIIKSKLREEFTASFARIECNARIMARNDLNNLLVPVARYPEDHEGCTG